MGEAMNIFWGLEVKPGKVGVFVPPPEDCKLHISQVLAPALQGQQSAFAAVWRALRRLAPVSVSLSENRQSALYAMLVPMAVPLSL